MIRQFPIDATRNWWGSSNGPTNPANPNSPATTGDAAIGSNVLFSPWLANGTDADHNSADGFQPVTGAGVDISGASTSAEGATYTLNLSPSNPGNPNVLSWSINWGDGTALNPDIQTVVGNPPTVTHVYAEEAPYTISATAVTTSGPATSNSVSVTVNDATITVTAIPPSLPTEARPTGTITVATFTDAAAAVNGANSDINDLSATIVWGDGVTDTGTIAATGTAGHYTVTGSHTYAEQAASLTFTVTVHDQGGAVGSDSSPITVSDASLSTPVLSPPVATEGQSTGIITVASFIDSAGASSDISDLSATITWGDGVTDAGTVVATATAGHYTVTGSHTYSEEATGLTFTVTVRDSGGAAPASNSASINVSDASLSTPVLSPPVVTEGQSTGIITVASFIDSAAASSDITDLSATITWGDGVTDAGTVVATATAGHYTVTGSHTYSEEATGLPSPSPSTMPAAPPLRQTAPPSTSPTRPSLPATWPSPPPKAPR